MPSPAVWALAAVAGLGAAAWRRRRAHTERVEIYFDDGSMVSFEAGSGEGDALLPLARDVLGAARA